jgi:glycosyltransferase involved in cell wall biosynthesis
MRVAYIGIKGLPARGGAERVVEAIVTRVPKMGVTPVVYCDRRYTPADAAVSGVRLVRLPTMAGKHIRQTTLDLLAALHAVIFGRYDLVHLHHTEAAFVLPILRLRYRVVSTSHGSAYRTGKWGRFAKLLMKIMDWPFMKMSSAVTFVSSLDAQRLGGMYHREALHIPNGVSIDYEPNLEAAREIQRELGLVSGDYFIFVAGRIEPIKGAHLAIEAVSEVDGAPLLIVGDENQVPAYGKKLREMAGPNVRFHPLIRDPAVRFGLIVESRCLVFPSTVEAMSMVLLEAAALGVPVVASDIPENTAVLSDHARYFESGSVSSLSEALRWAIDHPADMRAIAERAMRQVRHSHNWDRIASDYVELYGKLIPGRERSRLPV